MIALDPLGDRAWVARFASEDEARGWASALRRSGMAGVVDVVLAYANVGVYGDPDRVPPEVLERSLRDLSSGGELAQDGRLLAIPVLYDGADLEGVAARLGMTPPEVIARHSGREYRVLAVGFLPGFPYAGDLDPLLQGLPRRETPRPRVPAGSVAIAGRQTGLYPQESPGGWHLLGRTPLTIADPARGVFPIRAGDLLRFVPIDDEEYRQRRGEPLR